MYRSDSLTGPIWSWNYSDSKNKQTHGLEYRTKGCHFKNVQTKWHGLLRKKKAVRLTASCDSPWCDTCVGGQVPDGQRQWTVLWCWINLIHLAGINLMNMIFPKQVLWIGIYDVYTVGLHGGGVLVPFYIIWTTKIWNAESLDDESRSQLDWRGGKIPHICGRTAYRSIRDCFLTTWSSDSKINKMFFWIGQWFLSHSFPIKHSKSPHGLLVIPGDDPAVGKTLRKEQGRKRIHQRIDEGSLVVRKNGYHECFPFPLLMHSLHSPNSRSGQKGVAHPQALDFRFVCSADFSVNHLTGPVLREGANV